MIRIEGVRKEFKSGGQVTSALADVSLTVEQGSFVSLVGPSGCGKSTLLQIVAGLAEASDGRVLLRGNEVRGCPFDMVYVFQQYSKSIFPWKTVLQNVTWGLMNRKEISRENAELIAREYIHLVGLAGFERHYPKQLSGGMQQRVAIARALVCQPVVLLMDEPFSSVDAMTRIALQDLMLEIWRQHKLTILFVTHDIEEAIYLSSRVVALGGRPGRVVEDIPIDLPYPRNQLTTRERPDFLKYRHRIFEVIFGASSMPQGRREVRAGLPG